MVLKTEINKIKLVNTENHIFFYDIFCNKLIKHGKKSKSKIILKKVFLLLKTKQIKLSPLELFLKAIFNITPILNIKKCSKKKKSLLIPRINLEGFYNLGIQNLIIAVKNRTKKITIEEALAEEILKAADTKGIAYTKKIDLYKIILENRANTKYL